MTTVVPESAEVIDQTVEDLIDLYINICRGGDHRPLAALVDETAADPERVLRISLILADMVTAPLRARSCDEISLHIVERESGPGEFAAEAFVNLVLQERYEQAQDAFIGLALDHEPEVRNFLGLLLALVSV